MLQISYPGEGVDLQTMQADAPCTAGLGGHCLSIKDSFPAMSVQRNGFPPLCLGLVSMDVVASAHLSRTTQMSAPNSKRVRVRVGEKKAESDIYLLSTVASRDH